MPSSDPQKRFGDIVDNIDAIASYTQGMSEGDFFANRLVYDASERCLSRISEAGAPATAAPILRDGDREASKQILTLRPGKLQAHTPSLPAAVLAQWTSPARRAMEWEISHPSRHFREDI